MCSPPRLAVICVTHDSTPLLADLAASLHRALDGSGARIVVVDSGSADGTVGHVATLLPEAEVRSLDGNRGFAAAINEGVRHVQQSGGADAFIVMNPDVRLRPGTVAPLLEALRAPGVGIAVPQLRDERGRLFRSLRREPTASTAWAEALLGGPLAHRAGLPTEVIWDDHAYAVDGVAAWATGAVMAISAACLERVGPWEESYFLYEEEVDFALRAADQGLGLAYASAAVATRILGDDPVAPWAQALMHVNRVRLIRRRRGGRAAGLVRAALLVGDGMRALGGRPEAAAAWWAVRHMATPPMVLDRYGGSDRARPGIRVRRSAPVS